MEQSILQTESVEHEAVAKTQHSDSDLLDIHQESTASIAELSAAITAIHRRQGAAVWIAMAIWLFALFVTGVRMPSAPNEAPGLLIAELLAGFLFPIYMAWPTRS